MYCGLGHFGEGDIVLGVVPVDKADDIGDLLGLISDTLKVGYHLERGRYLPQVARDRLLL